MAAASLAYLGLGVADRQAWRNFAILELGLMDGGATGASYRLRMDDRPWRIALHETPANDILYAGFEVPNAAALRSLEARLHDNDIAWRPLTAAELKDRGADAGITLHDPDGLALDIVYGIQPCPEPFVSSRVARFVTDDGGLGHIVLSVSDPARTMAFFQMLGFAVSDFIDMAVTPEITIRITFLHCNKRHHTVAFAPMPGPRRLDHLMLEVATVDDVIDTYNRLMAAGYSMKRHLGRHPNDGMLSFYVTTPAGFDLEFGCEGIEIGNGWEVKVYDNISTWGHKSHLLPV
jgi:2,3-dihydroxybiphenyl 1,2-dioxygenase